MGISEIPQERIRFGKILGIFRKESSEIPPESGGKEGTKFNISGYLTIISWLLRDIFGNIQGIIPEKSQKFPVVRGKGGSSLMLGNNWPMTTLFRQIRKSFGEYSGKNPWNSLEWGEKVGEFNALWRFDHPFLSIQENFQGIFRKESPKFPKWGGKVGEFNAFWRFDHPFLTIQEKFQGIFRKESPKFLRVRRGKVGEFNHTG